VAIGVLLTGCSGGGRDVTAQVAPAGTFLSDQSTVAALNMAWFSYLFPGCFRATSGGCVPNDPGPVENPDGTFTWHFTDSDCSDQTWSISADGGTSDGRIVFPGGGVETVHSVTTSAPGGTSTITQSSTFPDGSQLTSVIQLAPFSTDPDRLLNGQIGTMTTPAGRRLDFTANRYVSHYQISADGHEGWTYSLTAPTTGAIDVPDTTRAATGSLSRGAEVLQFTLPASPGQTQWKTMTVTAPGGISGAYNLGVTLTGTGTVKQSGQILMTAQWGGDGLITATMADGHSEVGQPSGAAQDFLVDRWLWALGDFGPNPR
jgi:hypothetical protein